MQDRYSATTHGIRVSVVPVYMDERSKPEAHEFFWAYTVTITNEGARQVQLLRRTWQITDAAGRTQQVHGLGVVGEQPVLPPGESFEYTSGTPLSTPSGFMHGTYHMVETASGAAFDVAIPAFSLDSPHHAVGRPN
jgi:ApaG protein